LNTAPTQTNQARRTIGPRFVRDRATWVRYGQLGLFAFLIDGYAPTVPLLAADLNLSLPLAALHGTAFGLGMLLAGTFSAYLAVRIGRSRLSWVGVAGICSGVITYLSGTSPLVTLAGIGLAGLCGALMLAAANADLSERHGSVGPRALNEAAAISQGVGITAPLLIGILAVTFVGWRGGLLTLVFMAVLLAFIAVLPRQNRK
jgi:MFS family permease